MSSERETALDPDIVATIEACRRLPHPESQLMSVLHRVQERYGCLLPAHLYEVAQRLQVPTSVVSGVSTFYHFFRLKPRGRYAVSVCLGTACFVKGADKILSAFRSELGIEMGETTTDGLFSLENTRCLGVCGLAPVVTINERVYSQVTPRQVPDLLARVQAEAGEGEAEEGPAA